MFPFDKHKSLLTSDVGLGGQAGASPKWKKLAIAALRDKGGRMKIKKLQKALLKQTGLSPNDEIQAGLMLRKWVKCPKLTVLDDGYIELHSGS